MMPFSVQLFFIASFLRFYFQYLLVLKVFVKTAQCIKFRVSRYFIKTRHVKVCASSYTKLMLILYLLASSYFFNTLYRASPNGKYLHLVLSTTPYLSSVHPYPVLYMMIQKF